MSSKMSRLLESSAFKDCISATHRGHVLSKNRVSFRKALDMNYHHSGVRRNHNASQNNPQPTILIILTSCGDLK